MHGFNQGRLQRRAGQNQVFVPSLDTIDRWLDRIHFAGDEKKRSEAIDFKAIHRQDLIALLQFVACARQLLEFADDRALGNDAGRHHHRGKNQNPECDAGNRPASRNDCAVPQRRQTVALAIVGFRGTFVSHGPVVEHAVGHAHESAEGNPSECPFCIDAVSE